jgi:hypothetical protein
MIKPLLLFVFLIPICSCRELHTGIHDKTTTIYTNDSGSSARTQEIDNASWENEVKAANLHFKISDSAAWKMVLAIKELEQMLGPSPQDTSFHNSLLLGGLPSGERPVWGFQVMETHEGADMGHNHMFIDVDANTGEIKITDYAIDVNESYTVKEWKKLRKAAGK